ncbi:Protein of unknown function (DUF1688) [Burkholderiales bacterium JOSHI_001]|nr:Protein of unknown function (DUF1688) [Burkholderiales bacterium JOSHI_001]
MAEDVDALVRRLRTPATIRERCRAVLAATEAGQSPHFTVDRSALPAVAQRVATLTRQRFPDLKVPYHSRWRHFEAGGVDRKARLDAALAGRSVAEVARAQIDLTVVSVLLDAGAGPDWGYVDASDGRRYTRSEGLAVASFDAFLAGRFSSDAAEPCRVDADALAGVDAAALATVFQVAADNPLVGLEGRAALLRRLAEALRSAGKPARPGRLFDELAANAPVTASAILAALLNHFSAIWPSGQWLQGIPLGDVWPHPQAGADGWVPFHKLSQWLGYSLLEPFEWAGVPVTGLDALTGLPEYRNGGLLIDAGVLLPRDAGFAATARTPADEWVVTWRALTVALLDDLAAQVRQALGPDAVALPLACILEGGTWAAGRQIAAEKRPGGAPPVSILSDGTVF